MDARSPRQKFLDRHIGLPLYYCEACLLPVEVSGDPPKIKRECSCTAAVIAPRKSVLAGEGGLNFVDRVKLNWLQLAAALTGRCV